MEIINFDIDSCNSSVDQSFNKSITFNGNNFSPVVTLGLTSEASIVNGLTEWSKGLSITYNPCDKYPRWDMKQDLDKEKNEYKIFLENLTD